jgi:hypothetical protein
MAYYAETGRFRPPNRLTSLWITLICTRYNHYFGWLAITIGPSDIAFQSWVMMVKIIKTPY